MKLHQDVNAFRVLIEEVHKRTGYRTDVLEKDYYVVLVLSELAQKQKEGLPAYFKGGTALYKALKSTNRFSEDIDISVDTRGCTNTQNKKLLERATKKYTCLTRNSDQGETNRSEVVSIYTYDPITKYDANDELQRFGRLKVEATSFTISEPYTELTVAPLLYDYATEDQKHILETEYEVRPFEIKTITIERIFVDKLFASESYTRKFDEKNRAFEAAKHIYDLVVMKSHPNIIKLLSNSEQMENLLRIRLTEEKGRRDGVANVLPQDFIFFTEAAKNNKIRKDYEIMQRQYVLLDDSRIEYDVAMEELKEIQVALENNSAWQECQLP